MTNTLRFLVDENVPRHVRRALKSNGYDTFYPGDIGLKSHPDTEIFAYARAKGYSIVTRDRDFLDAKQFPPPHPGILFLQYRDEDPSERTGVETSLLALLANRYREGLANDVIRVSSTGSLLMHPQAGQAPDTG